MAAQSWRFSWTWHCSRLPRPTSPSHSPSTAPTKSSSTASSSCIALGNGLYIVCQSLCMSFCPCGAVKYTDQVLFQRFDLLHIDLGNVLLTVCMSVYLSVCLFLCLSGRPYITSSGIVSFQMRRRISISGCVRRSVRPSVRPSPVIFEGEKNAYGAHLLPCIQPCYPQIGRIRPSEITQDRRTDERDLLKRCVVASNCVYTLYEFTTKLVSGPKKWTLIPQKAV